MSPRYAVYFTPPPDSKLAKFGAKVIGYDCFARTEVPHKQIDGIDAAMLALATVDRRRYGFHATLTAPFDLGPQPEHDLVEAFRSFAASRLPVPLGRLRVATMGHFIVLEPAEPHTGADELAAACVTAFDPYRAAISEEDRARRLAAGLSPRQIELMDRWGYPYVFEEFRFHMTIAGPVAYDMLGQFRDGLSRAFAGLASDHLELGAISLMRQDSRTDRFYALARQRLTGRV